jgi:hypothetical protein
MAATSDPPRKGLNLANPGGKEYLIIGGAALGLGLLYLWMKGRSKPPAPAGGTSAGGRISSPTGVTTGDLWTWIQDHSRSTTRTTTTITEDEDDDDGRKKAVPKCPKGYFYRSELTKGVPPPEGARRRKGGGWCIPNRDKRTPQPGG